MTDNVILMLRPRKPTLKAIADTKFSVTPGYRLRSLLIAAMACLNNLRNFRNLRKISSLDVPVRRLRG